MHKLAPGVSFLEMHGDEGRIGPYFTTGQASERARERWFNRPTQYTRPPEISETLWTQMLLYPFRLLAAITQKISEGLSETLPERPQEVERDTTLYK